MTIYELLKNVEHELRGIDCLVGDPRPSCDGVDFEGWWDTSVGMAFGEGRLAAVRSCFDAYTNSIKECSAPLWRAEVDPVTGRAIKVAVHDKMPGTVRVEYPLMIVFSKYGSDSASVTSQVVSYPTIEAAEAVAARIERNQNGYTPWSVLRLW